MTRSLFSLSLIIVIGFTLFLASCTSSNTGESGDTAIAPTTTFQEATTTPEPPATTAPATTLAPVTTTVPVQRIYGSYEVGVFESAGYACVGDDTSECGDSEFELVKMWLGADTDEYDFIDFTTAPQASGGAISLPEQQMEAGLGVRIEPPTNGHDLIGESFVQITFSGMSARRFVGPWDIERTVHDGRSIRWDAVAPGADNPVTTSGPILTFPDGTGGNFITEMGLVEFGKNTMTWVVGLNYAGPSQHHFHCTDSWDGVSDGARGVCQIRLAPAPQG